ncbi:MAG: hypothetical protein ACI9EF_001484 [Pseudohongiellaceae bacterium]|jgi:hypothetical protein
MNFSTKNIAVAVLALAALAGGVTAVSSSFVFDGPPPLTANGLDAVVTVVHARPFVTQEPFTHEWRAERPSFDAGMLLVLEVSDPTLIHPRQTAEPVLFVGDQTVQRINLGYDSGYLVAVLPAARNAQGGVDLDLSTLPIFFDLPGLPEAVDAAAAQAALGRAQAAGIGPSSAEAIAAVTVDQVSFRDMGDVHAHAADLIEAWSPLEVDLISGLRAPRLPR